MSSIDHSKGTDVERAITLIESQIGGGKVMGEGEFRRIEGSPELAQLVDAILNAGENAEIEAPSPSGFILTPTAHYDTASSIETYPFLDERHGPHARRFGGAISTNGEKVIAIEFVMNGPDRGVSYRAEFVADECQISSAWTVVFPAEQERGTWEKVLKWLKSLR